MLSLNNKGTDLKKKAFSVIGFMLLIAMVAALLWTSTQKSFQSSPALYPKVSFVGEYRIGEGEWREIRKGVHIPATEGDVTLRGCFYMISPDNENVGPVPSDIPIAFFTDHINITISEQGCAPYSMDNENAYFGSAACGKAWTGHSLVNDGSVPVELTVHNPHSFGNETAVDELLSNFSTWISIDFERDVLSSGTGQRGTGLFFVIISLVLLGTALFSTLLHIKNSRIIWLFGMAVLFAGGYFIFSAEGTYFWNNSVVLNTTTLGVSIMLYMFCLSRIIAVLLEKHKRVAGITTLVLGVADAVLFGIPIVTDVLFYDLLLPWAFIQAVANAVLVFCLVAEACAVKSKNRWIYIVASFSLVAFCADFAATWLGAWKGGIVSKYIFVILLAAALVMVLRIIPKSVNATLKAKELEAEKKALDAELAESRISTMISQIRPHFIYNTLGSIEQLCELDPPKAAELVHNFAKYLRGNFGELDNPRPIFMSQEMEHVKYYISIEKVRFPDMKFTFDMRAGDFKLPALTVQPVIENAIKHGLMKLEHGGSIYVNSYETDTHYCVRVEDDGMGFDPNILLDERKHIGLRNIRERLKAMVGGSLEIDSAIGQGTKVLIKIPKENGQ